MWFKGSCSLVRLIASDGDAHPEHAVSGRTFVFDCGDNFERVSFHLIKTLALSEKYFHEVMITGRLVNAILWASRQRCKAGSQSFHTGS